MINKEDLRVFLENYKKIAHDLVKAKKQLEDAHQNKNQREINVYSQVIENIQKELEPLGNTIYSAILTYNKDPNLLPDITSMDITNFQMTMDEVLNLLSSAGINTTFSRTPDTF